MNLAAVLPSTLAVLVLAMLLVAAALSDYVENALINWLRGTTFPAVPTNFYLALFTSATADDGSGTEVSGGSYVRITLAPAVGTWNAPAGGGGATANTAQIVSAVASANWGSITHLAIFDASSGGNMIVHGALAAARTVNSGQRFVIDAGELDLVFA